MVRLLCLILTAEWRCFWIGSRLMIQSLGLASIAGVPSGSVSSLGAPSVAVDRSARAWRSRSFGRLNLTLLRLRC